MSRLDDNYSIYIDIYIYIYISIYISIRRFVYVARFNSTSARDGTVVDRTSYVFFFSELYWTPSSHLKKWRTWGGVNWLNRPWLYASQMGLTAPFAGHETMWNKLCVQLSISKVIMKNLTNHFPVNMQLILHRYYCPAVVLRFEFTNFVTVSGFRAVNAGLPPGSLSRSSCTTLNLLNHSKTRIQDTATVPLIVPKITCF
jgi:hypothetical protein